MSYNSDDQNQSRREWIGDVHELRRRCITVRQEIPQEFVRTPVVDVAEGGVPQSVKIYNRVVQQFAAQVRPKLVSGTGDADELWTQTLTTITVPETGETPDEVVIDVGSTNVFGEIDLSNVRAQLPRGEVEVSLASLREWRDRTAVFTVTYRGEGGRTQRDVRRRPMFLPVGALDRCRDQLDLCLDELGWLPETSEKDAGATQVLQ